jgi:poly-gamma-glutamate synthesis protein (capsule biosynthesis protein)
MTKYVKPYTFKGKILHYFIKAIYKLLSFFFDFKNYNYDNFEENPFFMSKREILQLGYSYYVHPILEIPNSKPNKFLDSHSIEINNISSQSSSLKINLCGDLMPYYEVQKQFCNKLWDNIGSSFFDCDLNIGNLETPICRSLPASFTPQITLKKFGMNGNLGFLEAINGNGKYKGFDLFSTANNHSFDMGPEGLIETIELLKEKNISICGTYSNDKEPRYAIIEKNDMKIGFVSYTFSLNFYDIQDSEKYLINYIRLNRPDENIESIKQNILEARGAGAEFVIFLPHFGLSYNSYPHPNIQKMMYRIATEAKPDMIIANHPHIPQHIEKIQDVYCAYSLGDFIAYDLTRLGKISFYLETELVKVDGKVTLNKLLAKPILKHFNIESHELVLYDLIESYKKINTYTKDKDLYNNILFHYDYYLKVFNPKLNKQYYYGE